LGNLKHSRFWTAPVLALMLSLAGCVQPSTHITRDMGENHVLADASPIVNPSPGTAGASCQLDSLCEPFYGMQFVYLDDLGKAKELGIEVVMTDLPHDGTPAGWLAFLNAAQAQGIRVIPWLWPQGWTWNGTAWQIDAQTRLFLQTVAGHRALFAVYALHEPYWNGCEGCGYSTATQQALYSAIKAIANVPLYSEINGIAYWTGRGEATAFADGICDYCQSSYYPFRDGGIYQRDELIAELMADLAVISERAPHSKIVWTMPAFKYPPDDLRIPSADEMRDLASIVYSKGVAGAWWYPWKFNDLYPDYLYKHPELYPAVRSIYEDYVREAKGTCCSSSLQAAFDYGPASITVSDTVWFTSTSSTCCGPLTYAWDWGDGTAQAFTANTAHQYTTVGIYTVTLSITDSLGYTDTHTASNAVTVSPGNIFAPWQVYLPLVIKH